MFIVFKGTDVHSGMVPFISQTDQTKWADSCMDSIWTTTGPQNCMGYVDYSSTIPCKRLGSLNFTSPTGFGNFGSGAAHKNMQTNFASHSNVTLGSLRNCVIQLACEAISNFHNTIQLCGLTSSIDIDTILQSLSYTDLSTGHIKNLATSSFPFHPVKDVNQIKKYLAWNKSHNMELNTFNLRITKPMLCAALHMTPPIANSMTAIDFPVNFVGPFNIEEVINKHKSSGKVT